MHDPVAEVFDIYDEQGNPQGSALRSTVHADGLWHKSAQLFLYTQAGELIVHQRALRKDLYAALWDHSIGEHLQSRETFHDAAVRGASEEFGLTNLELSVLGEPRRQQFKDTQDQWHDREIQQSYLATYDPQRHGELQPDAAEVSAIQFLTPEMLQDWLRHRQDELTPWFEADLVFHKLIDARG